MIKKLAEYPYNDYFIYGPYCKKGDRFMINLVSIDNSSRTTLSYVRYLMSIHLKRKLESYEHVDHIDNDKCNDVLSNFQILTIKENNLKSRRHLNKQKIMVLFKCPNCGIEFSREKRMSHLIKGGNLTCCSRQCSGKIGFRIKNNENLNEKIVSNVIKFYTISYK